MGEILLGLACIGFGICLFFLARSPGTSVGHGQVDLIAAAVAGIVGTGLVLGTWIVFVGLAVIWALVWIVFLVD